jgi:transmembrane sensor
MADPIVSHGSPADQAVEWLVRLQSEQATDEDRTDFASWYAASDAHRTAYAEARAFVQTLREPAHEVWDEQVTGRPVAVESKVRSWIPAFAVCSMLALALLFLWSAFPLRMPDDVIATGKGQHRQITLPDGSAITLNANTALRVAFSDHRRAIELQAGEAFFIVAKDAERPFEVHAADGRTRAVGTRFNVRLRETTATITVVEGVVEVSHQPGFSNAARSPTEPVQIHPNQAVSYSRERGLGSVASSDTLTSLAWQRGQLVFNKKPLADVIDELNEQWEGHIFVTGSRLRRLPVNGVFDIHAPQSVVRAIERTFHIRSVTLPFNIIVLY